MLGVNKLGICNGDGYTITSLMVSSGKLLTTCSQLPLENVVPSVSLILTGIHRSHSYGV